MSYMRADLSDGHPGLAVRSTALRDSRFASRDGKIGAAGYRTKGCDFLDLRPPAGAVTRAGRSSRRRCYRQ
jgi:hypothetical protein